MADSAGAATGVKDDGGAVGHDPMHPGVTQQRPHGGRVDGFAVEGASGALFELVEGDDDGDVGPAAPGGGGGVGVVEVGAGHGNHGVGASLAASPGRFIIPVGDGGGVQRGVDDLEPGGIQATG